MITVIYEVQRNGKPVKLAPKLPKQFKDAAERAEWEKQNSNDYMQMVAISEKQD